jgi:hypothetical protein
METLWFCLVAIMIAMYVILDGFDLGVGATHFCTARSEAERRQVIRSDRARSGTATKSGCSPRRHAVLRVPEASMLPASAASICP